MEDIGPLLLLNALVLGFRHGFDWDHIAAICDIVGNASSSASGMQKPALKSQLNGISLATIYAVGHAIICIILGFIGLSFNLLAPAWLNSIMERCVGVTLIFLGAWILFSSGISNNAAPKSFWMLALDYSTLAWERICTRLGFAHEHKEIRSYGPKTAFGIGLIHGIGAETASQILMIAAISGATSKIAGFSITLAFVSGLLLSNLLLSILCAGGFLVSAQAKRLFTLITCLSGVFSLVIGSMFLLDLSSRLPDIQEIFKHL